MPLNLLKSLYIICKTEAKRIKTQNGSKIRRSATLKEEFSSFGGRALLMGRTIYTQYPHVFYKSVNDNSIVFASDLLESQDRSQSLKISEIC